MESTLSVKQTLSKPQNTKLVLSLLGAEPAPTKPFGSWPSRACGNSPSPSSLVGGDGVRADQRRGAWGVSTSPARPAPEGLCRCRLSPQQAEHQFGVLGL